MSVATQEVKVEMQSIYYGIPNRHSVVVEVLNTTWQQRDPNIISPMKDETL